MQEDTYEAKLSFRLSRLNVFILTGALAIFLIVITTFIIAFTPLREYIPGYTDIGLKQRVYELQLFADSLEREFYRKDLYLKNIQSIVEGKDPDPFQYKDTVAEQDYDMIRLTRSYEDSLLRAQYDNQAQYNIIYDGDADEMFSESQVTKTFLNFFTPLSGIVTSEFDMTNKHYGIDVVSRENEAVKATLDGTVIFSDWNLETGYVIGIQHRYNFVSVYKHNSTLLKEIGSLVRAGETIAIVGESGELTTGPHLHFELWHNGAPVNPRDYVSF